jgi:hypothetical protein
MQHPSCPHHGHRGRRVCPPQVQPLAKIGDRGDDGNPDASGCRPSLKAVRRSPEMKDDVMGPEPQEAYVRNARFGSEE